MRYALVVAAASGLSSGAWADVKPRPDKYSEAAREAFDKARAADDAGNLGEALRLYEKANDLAPNPATVYNIADVERRMVNLGLAIEWYRKYLSMEPKAADRAAVDKLIDALEHTPGKLRIASEDHGTLLVDGVDAGTVPAERDLPDGEHLVELVTPVSYGYEHCTAIRGVTRDCKLQLKPRVDGNVIVSYASRHGWEEQKVHWQTLERMTVPAGHYQLAHVVSSGCDPVAFDAPAGNAVVYVHVEIRGGKACSPVTTTTRLFDFHK